VTLRLGLLVGLALAVTARASWPLTWGTYGERVEKGYLHSWGDEWMDFSADSLAIQVKTEPVRYRRLAWVVLAGDTLAAPINCTRLDSMALAKGIPLPPRAAVRAKPPVEKAPVDPDVFPKGVAATLGGAIMLGVGGQYDWHCQQTFCSESLGKEVLTGVFVASGVGLVAAGVVWIKEAIESAK
jgi:hypothetical protein